MPVIKGYEMAIHWEEDLRLGVPVIDEQHEAIFAQFNRLSDALREGGSGVEVREVLTYLSEYATTHFSDEENLMLLYKYDGLEEQRQHHNLFKENIAMFSALLAESAPTLEMAIKIDATLIRYFINHVRKLDRKMIDVIKPRMGQ